MQLSRLLEDRYNRFLHVQFTIAKRRLCRGGEFMHLPSLVIGDINEKVGILTLAGVRKSIIHSPGIVLKRDGPRTSSAQTFFHR